MSKLTRKQFKEFDQVYDKLARGIEFIMENNTVIMRQTKMSSTDVFTSEYYPGEKYGKITKEYGSDLALLFTAKESLKKILYPDFA